MRPYESTNDAMRFVLATLERLGESGDQDLAELRKTLESLDTSLKKAYDDLMANDTQGNNSPTVFNNFMHKGVKENLFGDTINKDTVYETDKELSKELTLTRQELEKADLETKMAQQTMSILALQNQIEALESKLA